MFVGLAIGVVLALLMCFICMAILLDTEHEKPVIITTVIIVILCLVVCPILGNSFSNVSLRQDIDGFTAIKTTYGQAVNNSNLSGLERMQITNQAIEQNQSLARRQASINAWWNVAIDKNLKNQLMTLTPIEP